MWKNCFEAGNTHVVDVDIKGYFDTIPHDRLMDLVRERIADGRVLGLIEGFLKQGVMEGRTWQTEAGEGTPQGGVISPLLANIYLDPLDWLMGGAGFEMVRYADDMVVLCRSREEAVAALEKLREWMAGAGLTLHPEKTRTVDMDHAGQSFRLSRLPVQRSRRGRMMRLVRPKSLRKLRESIKPRTRRANGKSMEAIVADAQSGRCRAGIAYFKHAKSTANWRKSTNGFGCDCGPSCASGADGRGRGRGLDHQRWPNRYFTELGLFCLLEARKLGNRQSP